MIMSVSKIKNTLIGDKFFYHKVFALLIPMVIQNTVTNVVSFLDNVMVGAVGTVEMTAVAIINQLIFIFSLCIFGGLAGAGIFSAQYAGAKDDNGLKYCFRMKWYLAVLMTAIAVGVFLFFNDNLIMAYMADDTPPSLIDDTVRHSKDYLYVMLWGLLPFAVTQVYASSLKEVGETKLPMIASCSAIFINVIFNYLLIFGKFGFSPLGVKGAAIATVLSRFAEMGIIIIYTHLRNNVYTFIKGVYRSFKIPIGLCIKIIKSGSPLLINEFLWSTGMAMLLKCYSERNYDIVSSSNIASTASNLFNVAFISMGGAISIMLGQALGAGDTKHAKNIVWKLMALAVVLSAAMGIILAFCAGYIPFIYDTSDEIRSTATSFMYVIAVLMPVFAFSHCCYFTLRSGGRTIITFLFDSAIIWGVTVPIAYILSVYTNINIIWVYFIVQALDIIKCILGFILVKKGVWIRNIVS